jgi:uncharacterized low-complexity protein
MSHQYAPCNGCCCANEENAVRYGLITGFVIGLATVTQAHADCVRNQYGEVVCGAGQCERDQYGEVFCAQTGGGALRSRYGKVMCGTGLCGRNRDSEVWCSTVPGGGAAVDSYGEVKCLGGCEPGTAERCEMGR